MTNAEVNGRRETRLLLATIAVSVLMLLLLARFRFPDESRRDAVEPSAAPLERLAARATYDELASIMADLERRLAPSVIVLGQSDSAVAHVPAVRLAGDRAIAVLPRTARLAATADGPAPSILNRFVMRDLVVVQVQPGSSAVPSPSSTVRPGPRYIAVMDATSRSPVVRPVYIGRTEPFSDPRWQEPLLSVGAAPQGLPIGSAVFSLDGGFIGLVVDTSGGATVVPADTLRRLTLEAPVPSATRGSLAMRVQPLTPALARASGAQTGVMVTHASPELVPSAPIVSGDVVQAVDGTPVSTVVDFQEAVQSRTPGSSVTLSIVRLGKPLTMTVRAAEAGSPAAPAAADPGLVLRSVPRVGCEIVHVQADGSAARAGLRRGDLIVSMNGREAPGPTDVSAAIRAVGPDRPLLLTVSRDGEHVVIAVEKS